MKADVNVRLIHDGSRWIAGNETISASGETFDELDDGVARALRDSGAFPPGSKVMVFMGFDFDTIPTWLRQYHTHYFNRRIVVELPHGVTAT